MVSVVSVSYVGSRRSVVRSSCCCVGNITRCLLKTEVCGSERVFRYNRLLTLWPSALGLPQEHLRIVGTRPVDLGIQLPNVSCWEPIDFTGNKLLLVATRDGTLKLLQWTKGTYVPFTATDTKLTTVKVKVNFELTGIFDSILSGGTRSYIFSFPILL